MLEQLTAAVIAIAAVTTLSMSDFTKMLNDADRARLAVSAQAVQTALVSYTVQKGNLPTSIDDLIAVGKLPARSEADYSGVDQEFVRIYRQAEIEMTN